MGIKHILLVEDDGHISKMIRYNLEKNDYRCTVVASGEEAIKQLKKTSVDLIILDIMLPGIDGFEVCRVLKQGGSTRRTPIIMLTARGEEIDRVVGLELGADDYVVKPFSPRELILRIKAILKRGHLEESSEEIMKVDQLVIDIPKHKVFIKGKEIELSRMEFKLLVTLVDRQDRVQTREKLLSDVWELDSDIDTRTIDTHIKRLRKKMGKMSAYIQTVRGLGYKFCKS